MPKKYTTQDLKAFKEKSKLIEPIMRGEFLEQFDFLIDFIKKIKGKNEQELKDLMLMKDNALKNIETVKSTTLQSINNEIARLKKRDSELSAKIDSKLAEVKDGIDGMDADEEKIIEAIKSQIKIPEPEEMSNNAIRDKLEKLKRDERLRMSAIRGLVEELKKINKKIDERPLGGGGGFSYIHMDRHFVDDETPSGAINGTNKAYTIAKTPNPTSSLKVYLDGQRMRITEDYTFSGRTITFLVAPLTNSVLLADYRF